MTENQYHKEYREYLEFALQKYLQEKEGFSEYDARTQVMQDFENVEKKIEGCFLISDEEVSNYSDIYEVIS